MKRRIIFYLNRFLYTILATEFVFLFIFYLILLVSFNKKLNFSALIDLHWQYPALFLIMLFVVVFFLMVYFFVKREGEYIEDIYEDLSKYEEKAEKLYELIEALRAGKTDFEVSAMYQKDKLFNALVNLRDEIKKSREEEEQRKREDRQRQWVSEGLAKFGAILRENIGDLQKLTEEVTRNLTKYLDAKQATFFLVKEEKGKKYLEMTAFFAYDRKKFPDKRFEWGEGLIGAVAIEKKTLFLKETSENFVEITSGLGGANPRSILIVPVKDSDDNIHGVIELASFKVFEDYQINFVEQVAESTGMTIANIKINLRTQQLLEESQKQAEQLAKQEEILRRSIAELEELQKKSARESQKFISFLESVNTTFIKAEFSTNGNILEVNHLFVETFKFVNELEAKDIHYSRLLNIQNIEWFNDIWSHIINEGKSYISKLQFLSRKDDIIWLHLAFSPVKNEKGEVQSVLMLAFNITEEKAKEIEIENILENFDRYFIKAEFDIEGNILTLNATLLKLLQMQDVDFKGKTFFDLFLFENPDEFRIQWNNLLMGKNIQTKLKIKNNLGEIFFLEVYMAPIYIFADMPQKLLLIGYNDTKTYQLEKKIDALNKELETSNYRLKALQTDFQKQLKAKTEELVKENEKLQLLNDDISNILDYLGYVVLLISQDRIYYANSLAENLWNVKKNVILGRRITFLLPDIEELTKQKEYLLNYLKEYEEYKNIESFIVDKQMNKISGIANIQKIDDEKIAIIFIPKK